MNYLSEPPMDYPKCKPPKFLTQKFKNQFVCSCSNLLGTIFKRHHFCMHCVLFFFFVGDQTQTSPRPNFESCNLWCIFAKSCWNINTRTMLRILFSLFMCKIYFLLVLSKRWIRREIINMLKTLKKKGHYVSHEKCWRCSFHFRYVTNKIMFTLQVYFPRSDGHEFICNFGSIRVGFGNWSEFFGFFMAVS